MSPRREICRVVLALNHSKRTTGHSWLNERVNSEKSAMRVAQCGTSRRGCAEKGAEGWRSRGSVAQAGKFVARRLPRQFSPWCVISMPYGTRARTSKFSTIPTLFSITPFQSPSIPPPPSASSDSFFLSAIYCVRSPFVHRGRVKNQSSARSLV